jgi:capsid protein
LQVLESDHLDTARNGVVNGAPTIQGIALGNFGEPLGYWLFPTHPGAWMLPGARLASNFIPARDVLHIFRKRRPGQLRDVSWLAPVLLQIAMLGGYLNRNHDPPPGNIVVWRGLTRLHDIARGIHIGSKRRCG